METTRCGKNLFDISVPDKKVWRLKPEERVLISLEQYKEYLEFKKGSIPKSKIKQKLKENKAKTDCRYCNNACDSYAVCQVLKKILEEGE